MEQHTCKYRYEDEEKYIIFFCEECGYEVKINQKTLKKERLNPGDGTSSHKCIVMPNLELSIGFKRPTLADQLFYFLK